MIVLACLSGWGCSSLTQAIKETPGFGSGFDRLTKTDQEKIRFMGEEPSLPAASKETISVVNGAQILQKIQQSNQASLLYFWAPFCSSESCIDPSFVLEYCAQNNLELVLIMEYLDSAVLEQWESKNYASYAYGVDFRYYKTNYCPKYMKRFKKDLMGPSTAAGKSRLIVFQKGEFQPLDYHLILN